MGRTRQAADVLHLSVNRKTSPYATYDPRWTRWIATHPNSFGLPSETTCPGRTRFCDDCYATSAEHRAPATANLLAHNLRLLEAAGTVDAMAGLLVEMMGRYRDGCRRAWLREDQRMFRLHWAGDFYSTDYAEAWVRALGAVPDVAVWVYTRSFTEACNVVPILDGTPNLALYLSVDYWNADEALGVIAAHPRARIAWCADAINEGQALARRALATIGAGARARPRPCPENIGRLPLVVADLPAGRGRGACQACGICPSARADIAFATEKR